MSSLVFIMKHFLHRDEQVAANVKRMLKMKEEFLKKKEQQKEEAEASKVSHLWFIPLLFSLTKKFILELSNTAFSPQAFKMRLIEEVRLHFNYTVNERDERFRLEVKERAKQLKEREKQEKKAIKKEKMAIQKAINFEEAAKKLKEDEERRLAPANK